jgi:hypothetical protein
MPVIEAQCASILVPHDHRHIRHIRQIRTFVYAGSARIRMYPRWWTGVTAGLS